jgi:penicillin-binding protein 1C
MTRKGLRWLTLIAALVGAWVFLRGGWLAPDDPERLLRECYGSTPLQDRTGHPLREYTGLLGTRARHVRLSDISADLVQATLTLEDKRFWHHPGVDPVAIARAALGNLTAGRVTSGASTITQQTVKLMQPRARTLGPKAVEALTALHLEARFEKAQILEWYLNYVPYGALVRGAEEAARTYFGKPAKDLTLAEAAYLAVLPRSPGRLDPLQHPNRAIPAQRALLHTMREQGVVSETAWRTALDQPIRVLTPSPARGAPHFADFVASQLAPLIPLRPVQIRTTLDAALQARVAPLLERHLRRLASRQVGNAAVVVIDNATGEVRAMIGSRAYRDPNHLGANNGATALRQPGSALKPFTYATAFDTGATAATLLPDLESHFDTPQGHWAPRNYGLKFAGPLRARIALGTSNNIAAVRLTERLGVPRLQASLKDLGFASLWRDPEHYGLALTLGNGEVTLLELTGAFATLARAGVHLEPRWLDALVLADGGLAKLPTGAPRRVFSAQSAFLVLDILSDPAARQVAFGRGGPLELPFPVAVKTGTSKGFRDNWAVGATPRWTVGVWVGNFDGAPMQDVSGVTGAGPLWHDVMFAIAGRDNGSGFSVPEHMEQRDICPLSGGLATNLCGTHATEWFTAGSVPGPCSVHRKLQLDARNGLLAPPACPPEHVSSRIVVDLPPEYQAWAQQSGLPLMPRETSPLCGLAEGVTGADPAASTATGTGTLRILEPHAGAVFYRDSRLPDRTQTVRLRAISTAPGMVQWFVDAAPWGPPVPVEQPVEWGLRAGRHEIGVQQGKERSRVVVEVESSDPAVTPRTGP